MVYSDSGLEAYGGSSKGLLGKSSRGPVGLQQKV